ncbi:MAG: hypothetical protein ABJF23_12935 [Bryobacteraceae bacterium]
MRKVLSMMLGLTLLMGSATSTFAAGKKHAKVKHKKSKRRPAPK